jgi:hypothetical protein
MEQLNFWVKFFSSVLVIIGVVYIMIQAYINVFVHGPKGAFNLFLSFLNGSTKRKRIEKENKTKESRKISSAIINKAKKENEKKRSTFKEVFIDGNSHCVYLDKKYVLKSNEEGFVRQIFDNKDNVIITHNFYNQQPEFIYNKNGDELPKNEIIYYYKEFLNEPWGLERDNKAQYKSMKRSRESGIRSSFISGTRNEILVINGFYFNLEYYMNINGIRDHARITLRNGEIKGETFLGGEKIIIY